MLLKINRQKKVRKIIESRWYARRSPIISADLKYFSTRDERTNMSTQKQRQTNAIKKAFFRVPEADRDMLFLKDLILGLRSRKRFFMR